MLPSDPFSLAEEFVEWIKREWSVIGGHPAQSLFDIFGNWAERIDLLSRAGGNRMKAAETFLILAGWFATNPEAFAAIRGTTVVFRLERDARRLPFIFDEDFWNHELFVRKYGRITR
jgi:hypothetical protein